MTVSESRSILRSCDVQKQCTPFCGTNSFEVKSVKHWQVGTLLEVEILNKRTSLWQEAHFEVKSVKEWRARITFGRSDVVFCVAGAGDCAPDQKWAKREGFCSSFKNVCTRGAVEEDVQRCISRGRLSTRDMFIREVRKSGRLHVEEMVKFAKMILGDSCSTSYDLAYLFRGRRTTSDRWSEELQDALVRGRQLCSQYCPCLKEISLNCCIFAVVKFKNWGSLAE